MAARAELIITGSELLRGARRDANLAILADRLRRLGVAVERSTILPDDRERVGAALRQSRAKLVIMTGGLGSTRDDRTVDILADFSRADVRVDHDLRSRMEQKLARRGREMNRRFLRICRLPVGALTLPNPLGLAEGIVLHLGRRTLIALPGVPAELTSIVERDEFHREIDRCFPARKRVRLREIGILDMAESQVEDLLLDLPEFRRGSISILPAQGTVCLLSAKSSTIRTIRKRLGSRIFTETGERLEEALVRLLAARGETVAVAESCTGGGIGERITRVTGSSTVFVGGTICYSNEVKTAALKVPSSVLARHGAVSPQTAEVLARNVRKVHRADWGIAVTGIAGPGGGSAAKPVGTVFIAIASQSGVRVDARRFVADRALIRERTIVTALAELWKDLKKPARIRQRKSRRKPHP